MVHTCFIAGCSRNAAKNPEISFYKIPSIISKTNKQHTRPDGMYNLQDKIEFSKKRQEQWISAIKRGPLSESQLRNATICSYHFISGRPADLTDVNNPDWVPCKNVGYAMDTAFEKRTSALARHERVPEYHPHTKRDSKKIAEHDNGPCHSENIFIYCGNDTDAKTFIKNEIDERVHIKDEEIQNNEIHQSEEFNPVPRRNQLDKKCIKDEISSDNNFRAGTSSEYVFDETLYIKKEIIQDPQIRPKEEDNINFEINQLDEERSVPEISYNNNSCTRTLLKYDIDETLDIKEEIVKDHGATGKKCTNKYQSKFSTAGRDGTDNLSVIKKFSTHEKRKILESIHEPGKEYGCEKSTSSCSSKRLLNRHRKFAGDVESQFRCNLCGKQFKQKYSMSRHVKLVHLKLHSQKSKTRYCCDKCSRSYTQLGSLNVHKRIEHSAVKPQFICDFCGYKTNWKKNLSQHITLLHLETSRTRHYCDKCSRSYTRLDSLTQHKRVEHASVKPQFTCDFCGLKTKFKSGLIGHITARHLQTSKIRHYCDQCSRSYTQSGSLSAHKRIEHAAVKPQFNCDFCGYRTNWKSNLSQHITLLHLQTSKKRHYCDKCSQSYTRLDSLAQHKRVEHAAVEPQFTCDFCVYKTNQKGDFSKHISLCHAQTSEKMHYRDEFPRSYGLPRRVYINKRLEHASVKREFDCDSRI